MTPSNEDTSNSIHQPLKSGEYDLQPTDWPTFFYESDAYNSDDEIEGLLRSELLVQVCHLRIAHMFPIHQILTTGIQVHLPGPICMGSQGWQVQNDTGL
jgi:hypothetical protein